MSNTEKTAAPPPKKGAGFKYAPKFGVIAICQDEADGGPIAAREAVHVLKGETAEELWRRALAPLGLRLFEKVLADLERGIVIAEPQDERAATFEPSIGTKTLSAGTK